MTMPAGGSNNRQAQVTVSANVDPFTKSMGVASKAAVAFGTALKKVDDAIFSIAKRAGVAAMGGGALALFGDIKDLQRAAQYQTQLTQLGVQSGVTGKALDTMGTSVAKLSSSIPASTSQLMQLATQLAAVGVNGPNQLKALTAQAEKLAAATNTAPGQLMTGLVDLGNSLGSSLENVSRYGDVLTTLQQRMGASAQGTMQFVGAISAVGAKAGMGEASILGFSAAFQKLGIDSASGAQAFNTIVNDMSDSVARGTTRMTLYANAIGESADQFKKNFAANPAQEFTKFVDAIAAQGQRGGQTLDQFGLDGARMIRVFASLSSGAGNLQTALNDANSGFTAGNATAKAAAAAYDTFNNKLTIMQNGFDRVKQSIGAGFLPAASSALSILGKLSNAAGTAAEYINSVHIPFIGDWASRFSGVAAGVGLAAGAFGLFAAGITKFLGVWRLMTGAIGGSAIRGLAHGLSRGSIGRGRLGNGPGGFFTGRENRQGNGPGFLGNPLTDMNPLVDGRLSYAHGMDPMEGASRTQLWMYRQGYGFGSRARRLGPMVDPDASRIGRKGLIRGGVGTVGMFPVNRVRQIWGQAKDTALHPINHANRDPSKTDPYSLYGGYEGLVRAGGNAREALAAHLGREGASDWEKSMAARVRDGFGDVDESAQRLKFDRSRLADSTYNKTFATQESINAKLNRSQAIELLRKTDAIQMATGQKKSNKPAQYDGLSDRQISKLLTNQSVWTAENAAKDATKQFDAKLGDKETDKLANPFAKLATKVKEISKSVTTDTGEAMKNVATGLQSFFEKALMAVVRMAQKMYAEVVRLKTMAGGGSAQEAAAAAEAAAGPMIGAMRRPGTPGGPPPPPPPPPATNGTGRVIPVSGPGSLPHAMNDKAFRGVVVEAVMRQHVATPDRIADEHDQLGAKLGRNQPGFWQRFVSATDQKLGKSVNPNVAGPASKVVDGFVKALDQGKAKVLSFGSAIQAFAGRMASQYAMQLMMWVPMVAGALTLFANMVNQTARDSQFAGQEIQKSLGRQWLSPAELAQQQAQAKANKADQNPWGDTEKKDAHGAQFATDHADTISMLTKLGAGGKNQAGDQAVLQQQINALVQQSNGSPVDDAGKQQIRQLLMVSGLSNTAQRKVYDKLDFSGNTNPNLYGMGLKSLQDSGTNFLGFGPKDLNRQLTAQAVTDMKVGNNPAAAALMLLQSNGADLSQKVNVATGNAEFQNMANGLIAQANNGTKDGDANHIAPDNAQRILGFHFMGGFQREHGTANDINDLLDQFKNGNSASQGFGTSLLSAFKDAGMKVDEFGHITGDTSKALEVLKRKAGDVSGANLETASLVKELGGTRGNQIYQGMVGDKNANILSLTGNNQQLDYQAKMHEFNQQMIDDGAKSAAALKGHPILDPTVGVTSPGYIAGLKAAIQNIQELQNKIATPAQADYQNLEALKQEDLQKMAGISSVISSPGQQMKDQADILNALTKNGVTASNSALVTQTQGQLETQYDQGLSTLKQAYMQINETHIQMAREKNDFHHQMLNSERDYNRQVAENNHQFAVQQAESLYQYQWSIKQREYSFNEQIRSMKYSMANVFGNAGQMVQAQYTQGAEGALIGMGAQNKLLDQSQATMDKLAKMGLSTDVIRVMKLDDPTNVAQAQRLLEEFTSNPALIKSFNDSVAKRLSLTKAIASDPNNSAYADMKRQFDKTGADAATEFNHATKVSTDAFNHSMSEAAKSFNISMGDFTYNFNLQMSRTKDDMLRMNQYISISAADLTKWAHDTGIPGLQDVANGMDAIAASMDHSTKAVHDFVAKQNESDAQKKAAAAKAALDDAVAANGGHPLDQNKNGQGLAGADSRAGMPPYTHGGLNSDGAYDPTIGLPNTTSGPPRAKLDSHGGLLPMTAGKGQVATLAGATTGTTAYSTAVKKAQDAITTAKKAESDRTETLVDQTNKQNSARDAIALAVDAAGKKAAADTAGKTPAEQATAVVKAQRDMFDQLTGKLGYVPRSLSNLNTALHSSQDPMKTTTTVAGDLKGAIDAIPKNPKITMTADTHQATGAVKDAHDSIKKTISDIVGVLFGNGLIKGWNWIASHLGLNNLEIPEFKGFATGGYTGDGRRHDPAGIVHAGEFVLDQEKTRKHRPLLEAIHRGENVPGYAGGGAVVTWPQLDAIRQQLFPSSVLTSAYRPGTSDYHGKGEAIDIGVAGNKQSGLMPIAAKLSALYPGSTELIHNPNGSIKNGAPVPASFWGADTWAAHANHVHWAMTPDALAHPQGKGGNSSYGSKMSIVDALLHPIDYLRSLGGGIKATLNGEGLIGKAGAASPGRMIDGIGSLFGTWMSNMAGGAMNWIENSASSLWGKASGVATDVWNFFAGGSTQDTVKSVAKAAKWDRGAEWNALGSIISAESGWNPTAQNPHSTAFGLFQLLDGTWATTGIAKTSDVTKQAEAGLNYIHGRYGDPIKAWDFHKANGWYGKGGLFTSAQTIGVGEAGPEAVLPLNAAGAQFMAQTLKASVGLMGGDPQLAQTLRSGRTAQYASPARSEMHIHHTDASTNFHGDITVVAQDPNEMARKLAEQRRLRALTNPVARR